MILENLALFLAISMFALIICVGLLLTVLVSWLAR